MRRSDLSRRALFGLFAGAAAAPLLKAIPEVPQYATWDATWDLTVGDMTVGVGRDYVTLDQALAALTRKAFVPKLAQQIYKANPLLEVASRNAKMDPP